MRTGAYIILILPMLACQPLLGQLKVKPSGFVGIGTNEPEARLHVLGEGLVDSYAGSWGSAFSTRVHYRNASAYNLWNGYFNKEVFFVNGEGWSWSLRGQYIGTDSLMIVDETPLDSSLHSVLQLHGVRFRYLDERAGDRGEQYRLGLVAQEVERVLPEAVKMMPDNTMAVAYADMIPLLVEAMKEQQLQINKLQASLSQQAELIRKIKKRRRYREKQETKEGT